MKVLFTEAEAAEYLTEAGIKREPKTLRKQRIVGGGIPFARFGRDIRYRKRDLDAWIDAPVLQSTSDGGGR